MRYHRHCTPKKGRRSGFNTLATHTFQKRVNTHATHIFQQNFHTLANRIFQLDRRTPKMGQREESVKYLGYLFE